MHSRKNPHIWIKLPDKHTEEKVYVISRFRADTEEEKEFNLFIARAFCLMVINQDAIPVAPHLYFPQILDDDVPKQRAAGMKMGISLLKECSAAIEIIVDDIESIGMKAEMDVVRKIGLYHKVIKLSKEEARIAAENVFKQIG